MDTRSKILTFAQALDLNGPVAIATGAFNPVRAAEARELAAFRTANPAAGLLVIVRAAEPELLPRPARAILAAALRGVDYVVAADPDALIERLSPVATLHLRDYTPSLIEHVRTRSRST
jgi:hypothetical protein